LLTVNDPPVAFEMEGVRILAPLSHELPYYRSAFPSYGRNFRRLCQLLAESTPVGTIVDVGANIGDTAVIARHAAPRMPILCIDGEDRFVPLLRRNVAPFTDITIHAPCLLDKRSGTVAGSLTAHAGTARFQLQKGVESVATTLDSVLEHHPRFSEPRLIKIDTDGFEERIIRGSTQTLTDAKSVLFIEYDPLLLANCGSDGPTLLSYLGGLGYATAVAYNNLGAVLGLVTTDQNDSLQALYAAARSTGAAYLDIALFHARDSHLAHELYRRETTPADGR
jgi:FkbM family methyltransferase